MRGVPVPEGVGLLTDLYELTMAAAYWQSGKAAEVATFELAVRSLPPQRSYLLAAGLEQALDYLQALSFGAAELDYLRRHPSFESVSPKFFDFLGSLRFTGSVWAVPEGTVVFAEEPLLRVTAPIVEAQIAETYLLAMITYQTSVATKAARIVEAAQGRGVVEFGTRRGHGPQAGVLAARASYIGGCQGTSNTLAGFLLGIPTYGTTAHSWVMAFEDETDAFLRYAELYGSKAVLLVDTYETVEAVRKALRAGVPFRGVRLDSGNLLEDSRQVRQLLDDAGRKDTLIFASGDLNEYVIDEIVRKSAPVDVFGVGTDLITSRDAPALSGIYKLVEIESGSEHRPAAKFSELKTSWPGTKQVFRFPDGEGRDAYDMLGLASERYPEARTLLQPMMEGGKVIHPTPGLEQIREEARRNLQRLPENVRRIQGSEPYPVKKSRALQELAEELRSRYVLRPAEAEQTPRPH